MRFGGPEQLFLYLNAGVVVVFFNLLYGHYSTYSHWPVDSNTHCSTSSELPREGCGAWGECKLCNLIGVTLPIPPIINCVVLGQF